eukprot:239588_1
MLNSIIFCILVHILIYLSNATHLYGMRWTLWAYTNGDNNGIKYKFPNGINEQFTFDSSATSFIFYTEVKSGSPLSYTLLSSSACWPNQHFTIDSLLSCVGDLDGSGWAGISYKSSGYDWDHSTQDYWIKIVTATLEPTPAVTPSPTSQYLQSNIWTQWAYTDGDYITGIKYLFSYGVNQRFTFDSNAVSITFSNKAENRDYEVTTDNGCFPAQNFNVDETLLCIDRTADFSAGWASLYYKGGTSEDPIDWSHWSATYAIFVLAPIYDPTITPSTNPTLTPTMPTKTPSNTPSNIPTYAPSSITISPTVETLTVSPSANTGTPTIYTLSPTLNTLSLTQATLFPSINTLSPTLYHTLNTDSMGVTDIGKEMDGSVSLHDEKQDLSSLYTLISIIFIIVFVLIAIIGYIDAKIWHKNDLFKISSIIVFGLYSIDFISDIFFAAAE